MFQDLSIFRSLRSIILINFLNPPTLKTNLPSNPVNLLLYKDKDSTDPNELHDLSFIVAVYEKLPLLLFMVL